MKKYDEKLKSDIIASIIEDGFTITEAAKLYGIDRRRVGELMKNLNKKSKIDIKAKNSTSTKVEIEKNITNTSKSEESVENILNKNGISLKEWELNTVSINNWTDSSNVVHYQTKISLVKKVIDLTYEIPAPISIKIKNDSEAKKIKKSNLKCAVILPDMQVGFRRNLNTGELVAIHDREAMEVALQIVQYLSPDRIVLLGDNLDLAEFSTKYTTPADMAYTTQASLVELAWWLGKLRSFDKNTKIDYIGGNHECFSEDTEILTENGFKKYDEVVFGEKIATFNKLTSSIEYQNFIERQVFNYEGDMYNFHSKHIDLLVTPNHRMYIANNCNSFEMIEAKNIDLNNTRKKIINAGINNNKEFNISDNMIKLIAWIITDGSTYSDGNFKSIRLYQSEKKLKLITNILDNLSLKYTVSERSRNISEICGRKLIKPCMKQYVIYVSAESSKEIYNFIENKYEIPKWVDLLSNRQFDLFHENMILGDGTLPKTSKKCSVLYGMKNILEQMQKLYVSNGYRTKLKCYRDSQYLLNITKTGTSTLDRIQNHISIEKYKGIVWDFTVPNDTLVVRRNGQTVVTGNCRLEKLVESKANILSGIKPANALKGHASISVPALLGLDDIDVEYHNYPQGKVALNSNLVCVHGEVAKGQSGATVSELVKSARVSVIQGHIHRHEIATKTTWDAFNNSYQYTAASFGCLCKIDPGFVPGMKYLQNWQNGIGVVWYEDCGLEQFRMEYIPIIKGRALYQKEIFECESEDKIAMRIEKETRYKVT